MFWMLGVVGELSLFRYVSAAYHAVFLTDLTMALQSSTVNKSIFTLGSISEACFHTHLLFHLGMSTSPEHTVRSVKTFNNSLNPQVKFQWS